MIVYKAIHARKYRILLALVNYSHKNKTMLFSDKHVILLGTYQVAINLLDAGLMWIYWAYSWATKNMP